MSSEAKTMGIILTLVIGGLIGLFVLTNRADPKPVGDKSKLTRESTPTRGTGSVQVVEFGDYQCPACATSYPDMKQIEADFAGKIIFSFRHFPLAQHANAQIASQAAEAARDQGKFWEMHDKLYTNQPAWENQSSPLDTFANYAGELGLDVEKFKKAVTDKQFQTIIDQDTADGTALGVAGTPTIFIDGVATKGFSYADLRDAINAALETSGSSVTPVATVSPTTLPEVTPTPAQ
ncbi:thioredoxin domain-containing protein [bacterium]|nr:MAG: thioredoxin domain-containing protein [bacterium]